MVKTYFLGLILGIGGAVGVAGWYPVVDHERFPSASRVQPNGGRIETFHIRLPEDRVLLAAGTPGVFGNVPASFEWPDRSAFADAQVELFKLRNGSGRIVGLAGRVNGASGGGSAFTDWLLYMPARGAAFLSADGLPGAPYANLAAAGLTGSGPLALETSYTPSGGRMLGGTDEFADLTGSYSERWDITGVNEKGHLVGEIEIATLVRAAETFE